jgi:hypothetical protein
MPQLTLVEAEQVRCASPPTSWSAVALQPILDDSYVAPATSLLERTDGRCLLYPGRVHALNAEPESLKSWFAQHACAERLRAGETVLYIDFEDSAVSVVGRLRALGVDDAVIAAGFVYLRPDEALTQTALQDFDEVLARRPTLVVIDGVTEAFSQQQLSPLDNSDVAAWLDMLPRRIVHTVDEVAVLLLDHVTKSRETRGRYAIGAQHKLAGIDVAYSARVLQPFARGRTGVVELRVEKDRPGAVREFAVNGVVAQLIATSQADGRVHISLDPPEQKGGAFRPTRLMQYVSQAIETTPGMSTRAVRESVSGKTDAKDLALETLVREGFVERRSVGQAHRHYSLRPYLEVDDEANRDPVPQP